MERSLQLYGFTLQDRIEKMIPFSPFPMKFSWRKQSDIDLTPESGFQFPQDQKQIDLLQTTYNHKVHVAAGVFFVASN